jgi:hypothetical protein
MNVMGAEEAWFALAALSGEGYSKCDGFMEGVTDLHIYTRGSNDSVAERGWLESGSFQLNCPLKAKTTRLLGSQV